MRSDGERLVFAAPRRPWRWVVVALLGVSLVLLVVLAAASPDSGFGLVVIGLWVVSLFGTLIAGLSWFVQVRQGGTGPVAWLDSEGVHVTGGPGISWPEVESVFMRRAETGDLLLCVRPADAMGFVARAPRERQDGMRANLEMYEAPFFVNVSAFWQGSSEELSAGISRLTAGRLSPAAGG